MVTYWYPVYQASKLKSKPVRILYKDKPLVLFRSGDAISCLNDVCPHRFASLSDGIIIDGHIECPYHGWQFDGAGIVRKIPMCSEKLPIRKTVKYDVLERAGLIFICEDSSKATEPYLPQWDSQAKVSRIMESDSHTTLVDTVENVLDPVHTAFVHKGLIRGMGDEKTQVDFEVFVKNSTLEMFYKGEENQDGLLSRLLEGKRSHSISKFLMPGVVELQYWGPEHLNLVTTLYFTPVGENKYKGFAIMTGPKQAGFGFLKSLLFVPIMKKVIDQDIKIMATATQNWEQLNKPIRSLSPLDLVREYIEKIIEDDQNLELELPIKKLSMHI